MCGWVCHICVFCVVFVLSWGYMIGVQEWGVGYGSGVDGLYKVSVQLFSIGMHLPLFFSSQSLSHAHTLNGSKSPFNIIDQRQPGY